MSGPRKSLTKSQLEDPVALDLLQLLHSITADGHLTEVEIGELAGWLREHGGAEIPAIAYLEEVVTKVLEDGLVTAEERAWVQKAIETVLPATDREEAAVRRREAKAVAQRQAAEKRDGERQQARLTRPVRTFDVMVAGVFHENRQATISDLGEGEAITLAREIGNPYSQNAVLLLRQDGRNIGYLPESEAAEIAPLLDGGAKHEAEVKKILSGGHGLIPVVWGDLYVAESSEGAPCPRVPFVERHPEPAAPAGSPTNRRQSFPVPPSTPRGDPHAARIVVGLIGLLLLAMVVFALWKAFV